MSKNYNRKELSFCITSKEYKCKMMLDDPYLEECWNIHSPSPNGFYGHKQRKYIYRFQYRIYRTWKYNRKKQYKQKINV